MRKYLAVPAVVGIIWLFFFIVALAATWHAEPWTYSVFLASITVVIIALLGLGAAAVVTIMEWGFKER